MERVRGFRGQHALQNRRQANATPPATGYPHLHNRGSFSGTTQNLVDC